jgi:CBS domain-containing protein
MKVSDFMTQQVITISRAAPVAAAIDLMRAEQVHALVIEPIHRRDAYGILTATDIASKIVATGRNARLIRVYEIMTKPCVVLNPDLAVEYAARLLTQLGIHSAPVIQGKLLGIITLTDLLEPNNALVDELEQSLTAELEQEIEEVTEKANYVCSQHGAASQECADAWSRVDSLQAELAFYRAESLEQTAFESFQEDYPEAFQDREYNNWCSG